MRRRHPCRLRAQCASMWVDAGLVRDVLADVAQCGGRAGRIARARVDRLEQDLLQLSQSCL